MAIENQNNEEKQESKEIRIEPEKTQESFIISHMPANKKKFLSTNSPGREREDE